jgi:tetratricopeptide (TPR) repeat protein
MFQGDKESLIRTADFAKKAIDLDPQFARAYVRLAAAYNDLAFVPGGQDDAPAVFEKAKALVMKAIALDPNDPSAYTQLGWEYANLGDYGRAIPAFDHLA